MAILRSWISFQRINWECNKAAVMSLARKLDPLSTHPYLSTKPRKKACRFVPFSQRAMERSFQSSLPMNSAPP